MADTNEKQQLRNMKELNLDELNVVAGGFEANQAIENTENFKKIIGSK